MPRFFGVIAVFVCLVTSCKSVNHVAADNSSNVKDIHDYKHTMLARVYGKGDVELYICIAKSSPYTIQDFQNKSQCRPAFSKEVGGAILTVEKVEQLEDRMYAFEDVLVQIKDSISPGTVSKSLKVGFTILVVGCVAACAIGSPVPAIAGLVIGGAPFGTVASAYTVSDAVAKSHERALATVDSDRHVDVEDVYAVAKHLAQYSRGQLKFQQSNFDGF